MSSREAPDPEYKTKITQNVLESAGHLILPSAEYCRDRSVK